MRRIKLVAALCAISFGHVGCSDKCTRLCKEKMNFEKEMPFNSNHPNYGEMKKAPQNGTDMCVNSCRAMEKEGYNAEVLFNNL